MGGGLAVKIALTVCKIGKYQYDARRYQRMLTFAAVPCNIF